MKENQQQKKFCNIKYFIIKTAVRYDGSTWSDLGDSNTICKYRPIFDTCAITILWKRTTSIFVLCLLSVPRAVLLNWRRNTQEMWCTLPFNSVKLIISSNNLFNSTPSMICHIVSFKKKFVYHCCMFFFHRESIATSFTNLKIAFNRVVSVTWPKKQDLESLGKESWNIKHKDQRQSTSKK